VQPPQDGSLGALVATGGLGVLWAAGQAADTGPTLAIYYSQTWRDRNVQPDPTLKPAKLAAWIEDNAYDAWLQLQPTKKGSDNAFPFMVPGAMPLLLPPHPLARDSRVCHCSQVSASQAARPIPRCGGTAPFFASDLSGKMLFYCLL
jgi:hypothetical protein